MKDLIRIIIGKPGVVWGPDSQYLVRVLIIDVHEDGDFPINVSVIYQRKRTTDYQTDGSVWKLVG